MDGLPKFSISPLPPPIRDYVIYEQPLIAIFCYFSNERNKHSHTGGKGSHKCGEIPIKSCFSPLWDLSRVLKLTKWLEDLREKMKRLVKLAEYSVFDWTTPLLSFPPFFSSHICSPPIFSSSSCESVQPRRRQAVWRSSAKQSGSLSFHNMFI